VPIGRRHRFLNFRNSACGQTQISRKFSPSCPTRGALANVTNAGQDAVDADGALRRERLKRTEKSCGPDTPTLVSSLREVAQVTVAKTPEHRGGHV
jgi:hypothetical protein